MLPARTLEDWRKISEVLVHPDLVHELGEADFVLLVESLREQGALPTTLSRWKEAPGYRTWPETQRVCIERELAASKAAYALWSEELGRILRILGGADLIPVLLKGSDLAHRYYQPHFLRTMADIDLYFPEEAAAVGAYNFLQTQGYTPQPTLGGSEAKPWGLQHQFPVLCHSRRGHLVEVHVGLMYAPEDRRSRCIRGLTEVLDEVEVEGCRALALPPEANVVYILAHMFEHHTAESPRFVALLDTAAILATEANRFRWEHLRDLALATGFGRSTALGLASAQEFLGAGVPSPVIEALWISSASAPPLAAAVAPVHHALGSVRNAGSYREAAREIICHLFPAQKYMRSRYPDRTRWPLPLLYPARWGGQTLRLLSYVKERAIAQGRRSTQDDNKEKT